ncbi:MAG TPA: sigma-70 family RNA polymerase sigma factor [Thermoanaerobaculia bacterium]|nr:sigma-70 family RNA polymerase sigma factor [Thermoanaerobaculia bacterium]
MIPEQLYLQHLQSIDRIAAFVARRNHLGPDDAAEFAQEVKVRLLDDDYAVIRKFEGRSSFTTYLTTVILRLFHQYRIEQWGKWRPSAEAKRLGDKAITLERLITRDGYTYSEAVKVLTTPGGSQYDEAELEAIYVRLPPRSPRPIMVSGEVAPDAASIDADAFDHVEMADRERSARKATKAIDSIIQSMDAQDRQILHMRFAQALKVPDIARRLHVEQKKVYKRLDTLFGRMRKKLEAAGLQRAEIGSLLSTDTEIRFDLLRGDEEITTRGPSHHRGGGGRA